MKNEREFFVGQTVFVAVDGKEKHPHWPKICLEACGTWQTVEKVDSAGLCYLKGIPYKWKTSEIDWTKRFEVKELLRSGNMVVDRDGHEYFVLVESKTFHHKSGTRYAFFNQFTNDLRIFCEPAKDIMKIYHDSKLVWERYERKTNEIKIELEKIEKEMKSLLDQQTDLANKQLELSERIKNLKGEK